MAVVKVHRYPCAMIICHEKSIQFVCLCHRCVALPCLHDTGVVLLTVSRDSVLCFYILAKIREENILLPPLSTCLDQRSTIDLTQVGTM